MTAEAPAPGLPRRADLPEPGSAVHLMGVAGAGMRGLAVLLAEAGYRVSGCDAEPGDGVPELAARGGRVREGHDPAHLEGVALLVRSPAVPEDHPEVEAALDRGIPVWKRARALAAIVADRTVVGVSGTHGKTTVTAMATLAAEAAGLEPTGVVGGRVPGWEANARPGAGDVAVVEADEYDAAFLQLDPDLAVVTAVEPEHLECYEGMEGLEEAFRTFAGRAAGRRGVLCCADDAGAARLGESLEGTLTYGFADGADYRVAEDPPTLAGPHGELRFSVGAPGRHNLQNAAGALAAVLRLGADPGPLADALAGFEGVERRLQRLADRGGRAVVDDYAHHPTEVEAALGAARRMYPARRLVAVFQPHLFSRTEAFAEAFARALAAADEALVLPIYPAREEPVEGVTSALITAAGEGVRGASAGDVLRRVGLDDGASGTEAGEVFLFMGAGDVTELAHRAARLVEEGG